MVGARLNGMIQSCPREQRYQCRSDCSQSALPGIRAKQITSPAETRRVLSGQVTARANAPTDRSLWWDR